MDVVSFELWDIERSKGMKKEIADLVEDINSKEYFDVNKTHFEYILYHVKENGMAAFNFCPNQCSMFGVVLTLIKPSSKLTTTFAGNHPLIDAFLFVAIRGVGGFGFGFVLPAGREKFHINYICEKLGLAKEDGTGFCELLDHVHNGILCGDADEV